MPLHAVLHLKSAVTALPDGTVIAWTRPVDAPPFAAAAPVPEEAARTSCRSVAARVLMAASAPRTAELFADLGFDPGSSTSASSRSSRAA